MGQASSLPTDYTLYQSQPRSFSLTSLSIVRSGEPTFHGVPSETALVISAAPDGGLQLGVSNQDAADGGTGEEVAFVCDPDAGGRLSKQDTLLKVTRRHDLDFHFRYRTGKSGEKGKPMTGLSFITSSSRQALERTLTVERQLDHNLSNRPDVIVLSPPGSSASERDHSFSWRFIPPPGSERRHGTGYRTFLAFVSFDPDENRFNILATLCLYIQQSHAPATPSLIADFASRDPRLAATSPVTSAPEPDAKAAKAAKRASVQSSVPRSITSPNLGSANFPSTTPTAPLTPSLTGGNSEFEDGPLFRATLAGLEKRSSALRKSLKGTLRSLEAIRETLVALTEHELKLDESLGLLDETSPAAYRPLKEAYMNEARLYLFGLGKERIQRMELAAIEPMRRIAAKLKEAESRKKAFDAESKSYYDATSKYLSIRSEAGGDGQSKEAKADERFVAAKDRFASARVQYHHSLYDLAVFQEVEVLSALTQFASSQHDVFTLGTDSGRSLATLGSTLETLEKDIQSTKAEYEIRRATLEEHRRNHERKAASSEAAVTAGDQPSKPSLDLFIPAGSRPASSIISPQSRSHEFGGKIRDFARTSLAGMTRQKEDGAPSDNKRHWKAKPSLGRLPLPPPGPVISHSAVPLSPTASSSAKKIFPAPAAHASASSHSRKKEGFLYAAGRPMSHQYQGSNALEGGRNWRKYWCVLAGGMLSEYTGWREGLELHGTPINLRFATTRESRNAERRFTFEVITPAMRRVYQATSEADMREWIRAITNSIESLLNGRVVYSCTHLLPADSTGDDHRTSSVRNFDFSRLATTPDASDSEASLNAPEPGQGIGNTPDLPTDALAAPRHHGPGRSFARLIRRSSHAKSKPSISKELERSSSRNALGGLPQGSKSLTSLAAGGVRSAPMTTTTSQRSVSDQQPPEPSGASSSSGPIDVDDTSGSAEDVDDFDRGIASAVHARYGATLQPPAPAGPSRNTAAKNAAGLLELTKVPGNGICAECGTEDPRWASWSLGIFICIRCCGVHRSLGTHISKVRSLDLDDWSDEQMTNMREIGNVRSKRVWEARIPPGFVVTDENVADFIRNKYCEGLYRAPAASSPALSSGPRQQFDDFSTLSTPVVESDLDEDDLLTPTFSPPRFRIMSTQALQPIEEQLQDPVFAHQGSHVRSRSYGGKPTHATQ